MINNLIRLKEEYTIKQLKEINKLKLLVFYWGVLFSFLYFIGYDIIKILVF